MKDSTSDEVLKLSREMQEIASDMRKEELLEGFLRQLGFKHDFSCWRLSGERNSLFLVVINNHVEISYPRKFEFKPNDDLSITVYLNEYRGYTASVDITYKGRRINLLERHYDNITEERIEEALKVAEQFDEICEIVKKVYNL